MDKDDMKMNKFAGFALLTAVGFASASFGQQVESESSDDVQSIQRVGVRMDCLTDLNRDKGETQPCFSVSGVRYRHHEILSPKLRAKIAFDPLASVNDDDHPDRSLTPLVKDTDLFLVNRYAFIWVPRPHLEVGIEEHYSVTSIPDASGLSMAGSLSAKPWSQTALSVTYNLSAFLGTRVKFVAGNGEGENLVNMDPQQYFGFMVDANVFEGMNFRIGGSLDGNSLGSAQYEWRLSRFRTVCGIDFTDIPKQGFSAQRLAVGLELDGKWAVARGLKVGLGWQRNIAADLSKGTASLPSIAELEQCPRLAIENLVVEDAEGDAVNTVQNRVIGLSASYRILDTYTIGFDYESRLVDSGSVQLFRACDGFSGTTCAAPGETSNNLTQSAYTIGGGMDLVDKLTLTLEYNKTSFDQHYTQFYYVGRGDKATDTSELFNARIAYNWD